MQKKHSDESRMRVEVPDTAGQSATGNELSKLLHQFNQPLTAISNYARAGMQLIDNGMADPARLKDLFEKIAAQAGRTTALSEALGAAVAKLSQGAE